MESSAEVPDLMWRAFPPERHANRKSWLATVARALGWKTRRCKALFYCEARVVTADEWRTLNERLDAAKKRERAQGDIRDELRATGRGVESGVPAAARVAEPHHDVAAEPGEARRLALGAAGRPGDQDAA
jgi:hypothetical protein